MYVHLEKLWVDSLQHTRKYNFFFVAFARWNFLLFLTLKTITNFSGQMGQLHAYVMLQMNPPLVYSGYCRGKGDRNFITFSINSRAK